MLDLHEPAGQAGLQLACLLLMPSAPHSARYVQYVCMYIHTYTRALSGTLEIHLCAQGSTVPGHHSTFTSLRDRWAPRPAAAAASGARTTPPVGNCACPSGPQTKEGRQARRGSRVCTRDSPLFRRSPVFNLMGPWGVGGQQPHQRVWFVQLFGFAFFPRLTACAAPVDLSC